MNFITRFFNTKAFIYHLLFSLLLIGGLSFAIISIWYPGIWATELGGYKLILTIVIIDLFVGPLCVGLSWKKRKSKKENFLDTTVITLFQLAFFGWGAWTISISRPVYIVFDSDRYEMIVAMDVSDKSLSDQPPFNHLPLLSGIEMAIVDLEKTVPDEKDRIDIHNEIIFGVINAAKMPKYFVPYEGEILHKKMNLAQNYEQFAKNETDDTKLADDFIQKHSLTKDEFKWFPIRYYSPLEQQELFMTVIVNTESGQIIGYIPIDPYEIKP